MKFVLTVALSLGFSVTTFAAACKVPGLAPVLNCSTSPGMERANGYPTDLVLCQENTLTLYVDVQNGAPIQQAGMTKINVASGVLYASTKGFITVQPAHAGDQPVALVYHGSDSMGVLSCTHGASSLAHLPGF